MIAFAANSLLCRLALKRTAIDPITFTSIRIISGAIALWLILKSRGGITRSSGSWLSALALFVYAAAFSLAYINLPAGTGALLLFAAVQATMISWGFRKGERLHIRQCIGLVLASAGLLLLLSPGISTPPLGGAGLMLSAGVAWGIYSLRGKMITDPASATCGNFLRAIPLAVFFSIALQVWIRFDRAGAAYAMVSGAITSGLGYVIWYAVLPQLKATSAATVQLSVPVLTAIGGILFLSEPVTLGFFISAIAVLGGIALVVLPKVAPVGAPRQELSPSRLDAPRRFWR